jgi:hypothetical protein
LVTPSPSRASSATTICPPRPAFALGAGANVGAQTTDLPRRSDLSLSDADDDPRRDRPGHPNGAAANVTLSYLLPSGTTITKSIVVPANSRFTINVETEDPQLASADVSTTVTSDIGIVVERAMYWPNIAQGWREAHNSVGVTASALRWGIADGRIGGPARSRRSSC